LVNQEALIQASKNISFEKAEGRNAQSELDGIEATVPAQLLHE
jgi:hypothetical protein|tara:strand:- start:756 stop:884 length:129 start_codon:yes stop_codon:yes gene_type:complete